MPSTLEAGATATNPSAMPSGPSNWSPKLASELASDFQNVSLQEGPPDNGIIYESKLDFDTQWGLLPPVELPKANKSYTALFSMDQKDKETHCLLQGNDTGTLYHGHVWTVEWKKLLATGGDCQEFASLELEEIPAKFLFPKYRPSMRKYTGSTKANNVFMKQQTFLEKTKYRDTQFAQCTQQEMLRCEQISMDPHRNLAQYLGVETRCIFGEERVLRIAYQRYTMDLHTFVLEKRLLTKENQHLLVEGIRNGMQHLHKLGLVHCDLRPPNVFVTFKEEEGRVVLEEVVVGDFDASLNIGQPVTLKRACREWWPPEAKWGSLAHPSMDEWCLQKIQDWMEDWLKENGLVEYRWDHAAYASAVWPGFSDTSIDEDDIVDEIADDFLGMLPNAWS